MLAPQMIQTTGKMQRKMRSPAHTFAVKTSAFQITPFMIAPVLPGETLKAATCMASSYSPPIKSDQLGCHAELYFFYVRLTDLDDRDAFRDMVVNPAFDSSALTSTSDKPLHYFAASAAAPGIDYVQLCLDRVVQEYFRDEDELPGDYLIDGKYGAKVLRNSALHSLQPASAWAVPDVDVDLNADSTITASEVERARHMWQMLVAQGMTDKSYDDYLKSYGIKPTQQESHVPELIRYVRDWTLPRRRVENSTGAAVAAWEWNLTERIDKDRFFREPGFIFGVMMFRPKVYFRNQKGTLSAYFQTGLEWLPGEALNALHYGVKEFADATGPVEAATVDYVVDLRDLLLYGEQFVNFDLAATDHGLVALPSANCEILDRVSLADVQSLFASSEAIDIRTDGVVNLQIAGHLHGDLTPRA